MKKEFEIKAFEENGYVKFCFTHDYFKGRVRKGIGKGCIADYADDLIKIKKAIDNFFVDKVVAKEDVKVFVNHFVAEAKNRYSIFDFKDEFIAKKRDTYNGKTERYLSSSSINSYNKAIEYFGNFLMKKRMSTDPSCINENVLNDFFVSLTDKSHNYKVKLHGKLKEYLRFSIKKGLTIDSSYSDSSFTEQYDNQETEVDDRSLTNSELLKLISLRKEFVSGTIQLPPYKTTKTITKDLQDRQRAVKMANLKRSLDCFLFMVSTGQYFADIIGKTLTIKDVDSNIYITYRRQKNNSYCKSIPICDKEGLIGKTLLKEYSIKNRKNFPIILSLNHFDQNLKIISDLAGLDFLITSKMARKTFASKFYFDYGVEISFIQLMLGHKDVKHTMHYLRISEDAMALRIQQRLDQAG